MQVIDDWFTARGWQPFDYQRATWQAYHDGASGLVHAPTGIGKTYAVWLGPLLEYLSEWPRPRSVRGGRAPAVAEPIRVLWLTPLRALATDTVQALQEPVTDLDLPWSVELRTGDTSSSVRQRQKRRFPTALVTTPESLSLQLTYAETRAKFRSLRCVIVDEWHELLATKRGVQTELALARLRRWLPELRVWGLSATLGNLTEARDVLLGSQPPPDVRLIEGPRTKQVEIETLIPADIERFPWSGHLGVKLTQAVLAAIDRARSTLLFCNTRSQAELWFRELQAARPAWLGQLALHHGSLDRDLRRETEQQLRAGRLRCVVCTSSLDLGVDFSPVDQVMQLGSPKGVARLLQRAGRSGHQPGAISRVICVPTHAFELVEFSAARQSLRAGEIEARPPLRKPLDVLAQHLVTVAAGEGFVADKLCAEVRATHAYRDLSDAEWRWTLDFVQRGGPALTAYPDYARVQTVDGRHTLTDRRLIQRHRFGIGTINSDNVMLVRSVAGAYFGSIEESFIARLKPGERFIFAGRTLELVRVREMTAIVRMARGARGTVPRWHGGRFPLSTQLGQRVRETLSALQCDGAHDAETTAVLPLLSLQLRWSLVPRPSELLIEHVKTREGYHWFVFPFEGRLAQEGLAALLAYRLTRRRPATISITANDYGLQLLCDEDLNLTEADWRTLLRPARLAEDLLACVNATELARRQFRDIARVAGLVFPGYPGSGKRTRQLQASSDLFFDVFRDFDPDNRLLDQSQREVLDEQLEFARLRAALDRLAPATLRCVSPPRLTPLAFPLWAEHLRAQYVSSEQWSQRVARMALRLESAAQRGKERRRGA